MNKINHQYNLGDKVYVRYNENCEKGVVSSIILSVERGDVHESYQVECEELLTVDVSHIGVSKEEVIDKMVKTQINSLSPLRRFINRYLLTVEYNGGGSINTLNRLHSRGYVIEDNDEIKLVQFKKVEYIKTEMGIEVRFHTNTKYYNEAYSTVAGAVDRLKHNFDIRVKNMETEVEDSVEQ